MPITGLDPDRKLRPNARRILSVRISEVWAFGPAAMHPGHVRELHDMRIACKRLRYLLEIFGPAFRADLDPYVEEVRGLQDILGEIHDRDVQVPMLHEHLNQLAERDAVAARALVIESGPPSPPGPAWGEGAFADFRTRLDDTGTSALRPGIEALLARRTRERDELYERFVSEWRRLEATGFRARLERALGL